jgi:hypothetical protein
MPHDGCLVPVALPWAVCYLIAVAGVAQLGLLYLLWCKLCEWKKPWDAIVDDIDKYDALTGVMECVILFGGGVLALCLPLSLSLWAILNPRSPL